jgi:hypothetical protein
MIRVRSSDRIRPCLLCFRKPRPLPLAADGGHHSQRSCRDRTVLEGLMALCFSEIPNSLIFRE